MADPADRDDPPPSGAGGLTPSPDDAAGVPELDAATAQLRAAGCVFAEEEARLLATTARTSDDLARLVRRRSAGTPLEQVMGWVAFAGLRVTVEAGVFVPRQRTAFLVECALAEARARSFGHPVLYPADRPAADVERLRSGDDETSKRHRGGPVVVDLCCGTGAVGAALATTLGSTTELHAVDIDPVAVRCASRNVTAPGHGTVHHGDLYRALPASLRGTVHLLVANAPYVPTGDLGLLPREARDHEPRVALDGGRDGLAVQRRVIAEAPAWLAPGGALLLETSARQAPETARAVRRRGMAATVAHSSDAEATVVVGRTTAATPTG